MDWRNLQLDDMDQMSGSESVGRVEKMAVEYFGYTWTINNFDRCWENVKRNSRIKSPEFTTGADDENTWYLQVGADQMTRRLFSNTNFGYGNVYVNLKSCKKALINVEMKLSIIKRNGESTNKREEVLKSIDSKGTNPICEFSNYIDSSLPHDSWSMLPNNSLTILFEVMNKQPKRSKLIRHNKTDDLKEFIRSERLSDVTIIVDKTKFYLHKAILASRSPVFLAMFEHGMRENQENEVEITDVEGEVMKVIILYIYTDEVENIEKFASSILAAANKYALEGLKTICGEYLSSILSIDNGIEILILADIYNVGELKKKSLSFIAANLSDMVKTEAFDLIKKKYTYLSEEILVTVSKKIIL